MKLTMKETKKKIKNNEIIQFTIDSYLKNVALNKKFINVLLKQLLKELNHFTQNLQLHKF